MATVNITCDQNQDEAVVIADANAEAGNHLFKFFTDGINVFNIASQPLSGDAVDAVTVTEDTSYGFTITAEQALLLNGSSSTYKHYLIEEGNATLKNEGSVTVTPLTGSDITTLKPFINGNNIVRSAVGRELSVADDIVLFTNADAVVCQLPNAQDMPGKIFKIKAAGAGDVTIKVDNGDTLITLETTQESCELVAVGLEDEQDWEVLFLI